VRRTPPPAPEKQPFSCRPNGRYYPLALGFVAVLLLVALYPLRRWAGGLAGLRSAAAKQALLEKVPFVAVVGMIFAVTLWARSTATGLFRPPPTLAEFGVLSRMMQGFYVWASYLWRSVAPRDLSPCTRRWCRLIR
jgi:cytochrome c oxidase assembly factor CtaG